jgi:uncharacterized tellurite resistance protein B-like protein
MKRDYQLGLLCLTHLLASADGVIDKLETDAIKIICKNEGIDQQLLSEFDAIAKGRTEREVYHSGIEFINRCSDAEKLNIFVTLYKLSEVDGRVHVKEIRLLLYSIKLAGVEFKDVVNLAMSAPSLI